jgi:hypothetical protein
MTITGILWFLATAFAGAMLTGLALARVAAKHDVQRLPGEKHHD